jgi:hypothetical protein
MRMSDSQLEVKIYQIVDDSLMKRCRSDGTGWDWDWADYQRAWMDATPNRYAYRCLPLTIANQTGWWIRNPVGFTAVWSGLTRPGSIEFHFDSGAELWASWINSQFGEGIITWNTPFLFRTEPHGSRLLICGPINSFKANAHPLTALIESDWMSMSFTMNWKLMAPTQPVRFEAGEPLFQAIPLARNVCVDLQDASVTYQRLGDDVDVNQAYMAWHQGRRDFHEQKAQGEVKPDDWQKDYFQGRDALGRATATVHMTKVKPPRVHWGSPELAPSAEVGKHVETGTRGDGATIDSNPSMSKIGQSVRTVVEKADDRAQSLQIGCRASVKVDREWQRWIAENLMLDVSPTVVIDTMISSGIARDDAVCEVNAALESPYFRGAELLRQRLRQRG